MPRSPAPSCGAWPLLGVLLALILGDTIRLNGWTVGLLVFGSLAAAELLLRMPNWAATQMPVSVLVVLGAVSASQRTNGWWRAVDTLIGAGSGSRSLASPPPGWSTPARRSNG